MPENIWDKLLKASHDLIMKFFPNEWPKLREFLPLFLAIWMLYQFTNLVAINKLIFFSWSQVINDTIALFFPVLFWVLWLLLWSIANTYTKNKEFLFEWISSIVIFATLVVVFILVHVPYILYKPFIIAYITSILLSLFIYVRVHTWSERITNNGTIFILKIVLCVTVLFNLFSNFSRQQYQNLTVQLEGKNEPVIYMNDTYVFTKAHILHNNESLQFTSLEVIPE